jgi:arylsulfatase A-like enzyme
MTSPNLLIIHTDQLSWWALSCYGGTTIETPNIDRLAGEGALFQDCIANSAICTPSRGCFLTGRYPHQHGAYRNNVPINHDEITFGEVLRTEGYATGYIGKWHLNGPEMPDWVEPERSMGFEDCRYMFNRGHWKKIAESESRADERPKTYPYEVVGDGDTYATDFLTERAREYIAEHGAQRFCLMLSLPDPHGPNWVRPPYDEVVDPQEVSLPQTYRQEELPPWAEQVRERFRKSSSELYEADRLRQWTAWYYGEVKLIDDCVGRLLGDLEDLGILGETIVVFTTDHGDYMGEHGLFGKNCIYETAYRIPLIVRWPVDVVAGREIREIVSVVDFHRSILSLMGISPSERASGRDFSPLLRGETVRWQDEAYIHHPDFAMTGIFTPEYELGLVQGGKHVLFDRVHDPLQVENLFGEPECREAVENLVQKTVEHNRKVGSPAVEWLSDLLL